MRRQCLRTRCRRYRRVNEGGSTTTKVHITWSAVFATDKSPRRSTSITRTNRVYQRIGLRHFNNHVHSVTNDVTRPTCTSDERKTSTDVDKLVLVTTKRRPGRTRHAQAGFAASWRGGMVHSYVSPRTILVLCQTYELWCACMRWSLM
ncbi:hypothetical protein MRX96_002966 [Rhipicephalus microplus]